MRRSDIPTRMTMLPSSASRSHFTRSHSCLARPRTRLRPSRTSCAGLPRARRGARTRRSVRPCRARPHTRTCQAGWPTCAPLTSSPREAEREGKDLRLGEADELAGEVGYADGDARPLYTGGHAHVLAPVRHLIVDPERRSRTRTREPIDRYPLEHCVS